MHKHVPVASMQCCLVGRCLGKVDYIGEENKRRAARFTAPLSHPIFSNQFQSLPKKKLIVGKDCHVSTVLKVSDDKMTQWNERSAFSNYLCQFNLICPDGKIWNNGAMTTSTCLHYSTICPLAISFLHYDLICSDSDF